MSSTVRAKLDALYRRVLPREGFRRDAAILGLGTIAAQVVGVAASPLIARLYGPSHMGLYTVAYAAASLFAGFSTFRFEVRIPAAKDDDAARELLSAACLCPFLLAPIFFAAVAFVPALRSGLGLLEASLLDIFIAALFGVVYSTNGALTMFLGRRGAMADVAKSRTLQMTASVAFQIGAGFLWPSATALVASALAAQLFANRYLARSLHAQGDQVAFSLASLRAALARIPVLTRQSWQYVVSFGIGAVAYQLPVITIGSAFGADSAGQYGLAQRITGLPVMLLSQSLGEAFRMRAARILNAGESSQGLQLKVGLGVAAVMAPVALAFALFGERAFVFVFGPQWATGGTIASYMLAASVITLGASITDKVSVLVNARRYNLAWQSSRLAYTLVLWAMAVGGSLDLLGYTKWLMICYGAFYIVDFAMCLRFGRSQRPT